MNSLLALFIALPPAAGITCSTLPDLSSALLHRAAVLTIEDPHKQLVAATPPVPRATVPLPHGHASATPMAEELEFYISSHAQALGGTVPPGMTPWLELRSIAGATWHGEAAAFGSAHAPGSNAPSECALPAAAALQPSSVGTLPPGPWPVN